MGIEETVATGALLVVGIIILIIVLPIIVVTIISEWKLFQKCGEKGWKSIIPYYNDWTLVEISGCHWWYFLLITANSFITIIIENTKIVGVLALISSLLSLVSLYIVLCINYNIAKKFHQGIGFAVGMSFVPFVFYLILAFSHKYQFDSSVKVNPWGLYDFENKKSDLKGKKSFCSECGTEMSGNFCPKCGKGKKGE